MKNFDIAIIGGGPAGYNAAANASSNGLQVVLFEHTALGGVCLNEGCIPTKTLLHSANLLDEIREAKAFGIEVEGAITPPSSPLRRAVSWMTVTPAPLSL